MSLHLWVVAEQPHLAERTRAALDEALPVGLRVAPLTLWLTDPVTPGELLRHGAQHPPRLRMLQVSSDDPRGRLLHDEAARLERQPLGPLARGGLAWDGELLGPALSQHLGGALALGWSEAPSVSWASLLRQGRPGWSLALGPGQRVVRFDGQALTEAPQNLGPEPDRAEAWIQGLARFLHADLRLDPDERLILPDLARELLLSAEAVPLG